MCTLADMPLVDLKLRQSSNGKCQNEINIHGNRRNEVVYKNVLGNNQFNQEHKTTNKNKSKQEIGNNIKNEVVNLNIGLV